MDAVPLTSLYVLVFIEHRTRRMHLGGITAHPTGDWTVQQARNLALVLGDRVRLFRFLIRDGGPNSTASFDAVFQAAGTAIVRTAVQAPRMNTKYCERLTGTLRRELLDRTLTLNQAHLRTVLAEYQEHYNTARPHQGIGQRVPDGDPGPASPQPTRHVSDTPKTGLERPDKRIRASRLKTEKQQVKASIRFRAAQDHSVRCRGEDDPPEMGGNGLRGGVRHARHEVPVSRWRSQCPPGSTSRRAAHLG